MHSPTSYIRYTWFIFFMVLVVIAAGGVVRMTQSGMGCPDWPTCFGRWIPPTSASQLPADFEKYLRQQDIDHSFNAYHTWIEYINRLLGALLGVFIFIHFIWSVRRFRLTRKSIMWLSLILLIAVAFQGWLGKKVVDDNLAVVKVTIHMLVALVIAALPLIIIYRLKDSDRTVAPKLRIVSVVVLALVLIQVVLGTQVREEIDVISKPLLYQERELWISRLGNEFFLHRTFSWIVMLSCFFLAWSGWRFPSLRTVTTLIVLLMVLSVSLGIIMAWLDVPAIAQPLHLLAATGLALSVFTLRLKLK